MTINELRIGNLLHKNGENVTVLGATYIGSLPYIDVGQPAGRWDSLFEFSPVKLDCKTLRKLGFVVAEENHKGVRLLRYLGTNLLLSFEGVLDKVYKVQLYPYRNLNYVHELQNIFFALFQEELDISPLLKDKQ